jgi:hypothetical protein
VLLLLLGAVQGRLPCPSFTGGCCLHGVQDRVAEWGESRTKLLSITAKLCSARTLAWVSLSVPRCDARGMPVACDLLVSLCAGCSGCSVPAMLARVSAACGRSQCSAHGIRRSLGQVAPIGNLDGHMQHTLLWDAWDPCSLMLQYARLSVECRPGSRHHAQQAAAAPGLCYVQPFCTPYVEVQECVIAQPTQPWQLGR